MPPPALASSSCPLPAATKKFSFTVGTFVSTFRKGLDGGIC
jgi:hypothetical protein